MAINDQIFRELVKNGPTEEEDGTRAWNVSNSKLWYITPEQAQGWLDIEESEIYSEEVIKVEVDLIKEHLQEIGEILEDSGYNIIDLGCGNGKKASLFLEELNSYLDLRYCPIDISSYMVDKAIDNIKEIDAGEVIDFKWNVSDFENLINITPLLREDGYTQHLLLLLGNTFGNFEPEDLLNSIRKGMSKGDFLLVGNSLITEEKEKIKEQYDSKIIHDFCCQPVKELGFKEEEIERCTRIKGQRLEMFYRLKVDKDITHLGRTAHLKEGDIIITIFSHKYRQKELKETLDEFFTTERLWTNEEESHALALCKV